MRSSTTTHDVSRDSVKEIVLFNHMVWLATQSVVMHARGHRVSEQFGNLIQFGERLALEARRASHRARRDLRQEQFEKAVQATAR